MALMYTVLEQALSPYCPSNTGRAGRRGNDETAHARIRARRLHKISNDRVLRRLEQIKESPGLRDGASVVSPCALHHPFVPRERVRHRHVNATRIQLDARDQVQHSVVRLFGIRPQQRDSDGEEHLRRHPSSFP